MGQLDAPTRKPLLNSTFDSSSNAQHANETKEDHSIHTRSMSPTQNIESDSVKKSSSTHFGSIFGKGWTAEVISCVLALAALLGLVVTLLEHQNKPLPKWPQLVTINSIVSLFSLLIRAGVCFVVAEGISQTKWQWFRKPRKLADMERFDAASRGGWGSLILLCRSGTRRPHWIAALGAFVMIFASLTGFFTQQLVVFRDCPQKVPSAAAGIYRTNIYNATGIPISGANWDTYVPMVVGINVGIIQPVTDLTSVLSHNCDTGNCTFPSQDGTTFSTVGVSHSYKDVTSELRVVGSTQNATMSLNMTTSATAAGKPLLFPTVLNSIVLVTGAVSGDYDSTGAISTVKMIFRKDINCTNLTAISCSIFPSVQNYGANITNARLEETLVDSMTIGRNLLPAIRPNGGYPGSGYEALQVAYKLAKSNIVRDGARHVCNRQDSDGVGLVPVAEDNVDAAPTGQPLPKANSSRVWYYPRDCVYTFGRASAVGIESYMEEIFNNQQFVYGQRNGGNTGSVHLRQIFQSGNASLSTIDGLFKNIATAMTTVIHTHGFEGKAVEARGDIMTNTTCARINWHWISFPAAMVGLAAIFLVLVSFESRGVKHDKL